MCVSPIPIVNPNFGKKPEGVFKLKDCSASRIYVPCGYCDECIHQKQQNVIQRVQLVSKDSYVFYATLTYNPESLPCVVTSTGYSIPYADLGDFQRVLKRIRVHNLFKFPFKYLLVSERGSKRSRPHFHCLFFFKKIANWDDADLLGFENYLWHTLLDNWSRNIGSDKKPIYQPLCTFKQKYIKVDK